MAKSSNIPLPRLAIIIAIILIVSFLYVWQRIQIFHLGYKIKSAEKRLSKLQEENTVFQLKISSLQSPQNIKKEVKRLGLDLGPPKERQIVRVK